MPPGPAPSAASRGTPRENKELPAQVVQFTAPLFFTSENGVTCVVDLMRIGRADDACSVRMMTEDGSAKSFLKYTPVNTEVRFGPGEVMKSISVQIFNDALFDTTLEFRIHLSEAVNCHLGKYLASCRVLIMDDDIFPSNKFKGKVCGDDFDEEELSRETITLVMTFMRFAFLRVPGVWWRTLVYVLVDQLHNAYYILCIWIKVYTVDVVLNSNYNSDDEEINDNLIVSGDRHSTMVFLAAIFVAPNLMLMLVDYLKIGPLDVGRLIRAHLQVNLFRRYLNYTEKSQCDVPVQDLTCAMDNDIPMVVEQGYCFVFDLLRDAGKIVIVSLWMLYQDWRSIFPLLLFPTTMFFFVKARRFNQVELENRLIDAEQDSAGCVVSSVDGFEMIRDYRMRHFFSDKFKDFLADAFGAQNRLELYGFWNNSFLPWITLGCIGFYMAFGSQLVLLQMTSLGSFLAMLEILREWGQRFQALYEVIEKGIQAGSPLVQIVKMLNLSTDVPHRMLRNRERRQYMKEQLALSAVGTVGDERAFTYDRMPIQVNSLKMAYTKALRGFSCQVAAGSLVYVTGAHTMGKTTMLKVIADVCHPDSGCAVYSSHNRCLYVAERPEIIPKLNLYENLTFGTKRPDVHRVRNIFMRMRLDGSGLLRLLDREIADLPIPEGGCPATPEESGSMEESQLLPARRTLSGASGGSGGRDRSPQIVREESAWQKQISFSEIKRIHLARALIYNPEFLVMNKPMEAIDSMDRQVILDILREFVNERGVSLDKATKHFRRPRTLLFSGNQTEDAKKNLSISDTVWLMKKGGVQVTQRADFAATEAVLDNVAHVLEGDVDEASDQIVPDLGERIGESAPMHDDPPPPSTAARPAGPPLAPKPDMSPQATGTLPPDVMQSQPRSSPSGEFSALPEKWDSGTTWRVQLMSTSGSGEETPESLSRTHSTMTARFEAMDGAKRAQDRALGRPEQVPLKEGKCWGRSCS